MPAAIHTSMEAMQVLWGYYGMPMVEDTADLIQILVENIVRLSVSAEPQNAGNVLVLNLHLIGKVN